MEPILDAPIWVIAPLLAVLLWLAHELGVQMRRLVLRRDRARNSSDGEWDGGQYLRAALTLLTLLIGFTFGASLERYNMRRNLVEREAIGIGSYYRDLLVLEEPRRTHLAGNLIHYLDTREAYAHIPNDREFARATSNSEAAGLQLWLDAISVLRGDATPNSRATLASVDEMLMAGVARRNAIAARVPLAIVCAVVLYAHTVAVFLGYSTKRGERLMAAPALTFSMLALSIGLILELDGPRSGVIQVSQKPVINAIERIHRFEIKRRVEPPEPWLAATP